MEIKVLRNEKVGTISKVEECTTKNNETRWRVVVSTALNVNEEDITSDNTDFTAFMLNANEQTEFSVFMPTIEGWTTEKFANAVVGKKQCSIIVFKVKISDLAEGKFERVKYTNSEGKERITSTMSRVFIKGSTNADENLVVDALRNELAEHFENDGWEKYDAQQQAQQAQKAQRKPLPW